MDPEHMFVGYHFSMKDVIVHCNSGKTENMAINAGGCVSLVVGGYRNSCFIL